MPDSPVVKSSSKLKPLAALWPFLRPQAGLVVAASIALVVAAMATLALPVAFRYMIDLGFSVSNASRIDRYFLALFVVAVVLAIATALRYFLVSRIGERLVADLRCAVYQHVLEIDAEGLETTRTGEVLSRLTTDTTLIQSVIGSSVSIAMRNALLLIGGLIMLVLTSVKLSSLILLLIPLVMVPLIVFGRRVRFWSRQSQDRVADASALAQEVISAVPTVQAFTQQSFERQRFSHSVEAAYTTALQRIKTRSALTAMVILLVFGAVVLVLRVGAHAVLGGTMTAGELGQFLLYAVFTAGAVGALSETWGEIQRAAGATERLSELLEYQPGIRSPAAPEPLHAEHSGCIEFENVTFCYPSRPTQPALREFSLSIKAGETVALVGPSGAGKSTVFQLLLRFYDPQSGSIEVSGTDVVNADLNELRRSLALVPQDSVIFADTALENIRYGCPDASDDKVRQAAVNASADEFIRAQPEGYQAHLGERGLRLSGGQKQRIAIARAMLKDAPIILLDEATSALDAESEQAVQQALAKLTKKRTTLVIAHRLATVLEADRIVVMEQGRIVAIGHHEELMAAGGLYARLAKLQFRSPDLVA